jgi:ech hydrogenase subunit D
MPSISPAFFAAFLVENEILDQFGTIFEDLVLDFGGTLYLDEDDDITATPFCKYGVKKA